MIRAVKDTASIHDQGGFVGQHQADRALVSAHIDRFIIGVEHKYRFFHS